MSAPQPRKASRRARSVQIADDQLKANEALIKARFYCWALTSFAGEWPACAHEIARQTGVRIPVETLRQNFRPTNARALRPPRRFRNLTYLRALYDCAEKFGYLRGYHLAGGDEGHHAALGLTEFIGGSLRAPAFAGTYRGEWDLGSTMETLDLQIVATSAKAPVSVLLAETIEDPGSEVPIELVRWQGWLVSNKAGMVVICVRNAYEGAELITVLQGTPGLFSGAPPDQMAVFRYSGASRVALRPVDPGTEIASVSDQLIPKNLLERSARILTRTG